MSTKKTSSITAFVVMNSLAKLLQDPQWQAFSSEEMRFFATQFSRHASNSWFRKMYSFLPLSIHIRLIDALIPGMLHHYLFRKLLIEAQVKKALQNNVKQFVVLGGGMDSLALRMAEQHPEAQFFELDLPETQKLKLQILEEMNFSIPLNCKFEPIDLAKNSLTDKLSKHADFNQAAATMVVLEGVSMYLVEPQIRQMFLNLSQLGHGPLSIIFGVLSIPVKQGRWLNKIVVKFLNIAGERVDWNCASSDMPGFMASVGYELKEWMPYKTLQSLYRSPADISRVPEEDEHYYLASKTEQHAPTRSIHQIPLIAPAH